MHAMHQPHGAQEDIQSMAQVVVQRSDGAITGIFAAEQTHHVVEGGPGYAKIVCGVDAPDDLDRLGPNLIRISIGEGIVDLSGGRGVFHGLHYNGRRSRSSSSYRALRKPWH